MPPPSDDVPRPPSSAYAPPQPATPINTAVLPLTQSAWYTRIDYFHWNERIEGQDFVNESGPLWTLGYQRRVGRERFRGELFWADVDYEGAGQFEDGSLDPLSSKTGYLGLRGEYELLMEPDWLPRRTLLLGLGTRFWVRDLKDGVSDNGSLVLGYQETWWTIYPYLGIEGRRELWTGGEFYASARVGMTAVTYEHVSYFDVGLYPRLGVVGGAELGLRGQHFFCAAVFDTMSWSHSHEVRDPWDADSVVFQPSSVMYTVGMRAGVSF
jgi:hypothetical protein